MFNGGRSVSESYRPEMTNDVWSRWDESDSRIRLVSMYSTCATCESVKRETLLPALSSAKGRDPPRKRVSKTFLQHKTMRGQSVGNALLSCQSVNSARRTV